MNNSVRRVLLLAQPSDNNWPAEVFVWSRPLQGGDNETRPFKKKGRLTLQFWQVSLLPYYQGLSTTQLIVTSAHRKQDRIVTINSSHVWSAFHMPGNKEGFSCIISLKLFIGCLHFHPGSQEPAQQGGISSGFKATCISVLSNGHKSISHTLPMFVSHSPQVCTQM